MATSAEISTRPEPKAPRMLPGSRATPMKRQAWKRGPTPNPLFVPSPASPPLAAFAPRPPFHGIGDPSVDVGFVPAGAVGADPELGRERALGDLAVERGSGQTGPGEDGFETDDTVWFSHGGDASHWRFLTAPEPEGARNYLCARNI